MCRISHTLTNVLHWVATRPAGGGAAELASPEPDPLDIEPPAPPLELRQATSDPRPSTAVAGAGKTVWGKATKKSERKPTRVETATCPICGRGFSATALNSDINAHVDACMNAMANE